MRAALRSRQPELGPSRLVLCGGPVGGPVPEAELMACDARDERGYTGVLIAELTSRTTRENVRNAIPFIEDTDRIKIVSNSLHAEQAACTSGSSGPTWPSGWCPPRTTGPVS